MSDRVAIVVGAGGLLGRTVASKLAADGFNVVGVDRSEEALRELPDRTMAGDATDAAVAKAFIDRIVAEVARLRCMSTPWVRSRFLTPLPRHPKISGS